MELKTALSRVTSSWTTQRCGSTAATASSDPIDMAEAIRLTFLTKSTRTTRRAWHASNTTLARRWFRNIHSATIWNSFDSSVQKTQSAIRKRNGPSANAMRNWLINWLKFARSIRTLWSTTKSCLKSSVETTMRWMDPFLGCEGYDLTSQNVVGNIQPGNH